MKKINIIIIITIIYTLQLNAQNGWWWKMDPGTELNEETKNYLSSLTIPLEDSQIVNIDMLISFIKDSLNISSLSTKGKIFYLHANETSEAGTHNIINRAYDATIEGTVTFTKWQGFTGNAINGYLNTTYTPSIDSGVYKTYNSSVGIYSRTDVNGTYCDLCSRIGSGNIGTQIRIRETNLINAVMNNTVLATVSNTDSRGFYFLSQATPLNIKYYKDGDSVFTKVNSTTGNGKTTFPIFIGALNSAGTPLIFSPRQYSITWIGAGLTTQEVKRLNNCIEWYLDQIGAGVQ